MIRVKAIIGIAILLLFNVSCHKQYAAKSLVFNDYKVNNSIPSNQKLNELIRPYADSVHKSMNDVIAVSSVSLDKVQPEGTLGNLMADIMLIKAKEKYGVQVDCAVMNYGGIRLPVIAAGNITRGKIFELSPFDNLIVLQIVDGTILKTFLDHIASRKGWPVSGIKMTIKNKVATNVLINGQPLDPNQKYTMALLDYVANGGDDASMLRTVPQINHGFIYRDAILEYMIESNKAGKKISSQLENRITNAD